MSVFLELREGLLHDLVAAVFPALRAGTMRHDVRSTFGTKGGLGRGHLQLATRAVATVSRVSLLRERHITEFKRIRETGPTRIYPIQRVK